MNELATEVIMTSSKQSASTRFLLQINRRMCADVTTNVRQTNGDNNIIHLVRCGNEATQAARSSPPAETLLHAAPSGHLRLASSPHDFVRLLDLHLS